MSLVKKLENTLWIVGFPIIGYLACSGMDSVSEMQPYIESLKDPFTITKGIAGAIYTVFLFEVMYQNSKSKK